MKTPQWLVDFYRKWWAAVTPPDGGTLRIDANYVHHDRAVTLDKIPRYTPDAVTAQRDAAALVDNAYQNAMKDPPAGWPKKRKRQPIKARKALKKAKRRK